MEGRLARGARAFTGGCCSLPAAVLLVAFTALPGVATLYTASSRRRKAEPALAWVGLDNYRRSSRTRSSGRSLANNAWFALGTIPCRSRSPC
jgi:sn-glycerol 3-phosphate transport system permease protein